MKKTIGIDELIIGMYVSRITKTNGTAVMKTKGWIKNEDIIAKLKELNVLEVEIDISKSSLPVENIDNELREPSTTQLSDNDFTIQADDKPPVSFSDESKHALMLYAEAREIQRSAFEKIHLTGHFNIRPFRKMAGEFFDSIFRNQDALLCLTKIQNKDTYLLEHSINVGILLAIFAKHLNLSKEIGLKLTLAGLLHDIGKSKVPNEILFKESKLTTEEFDAMKLHTLYGEKILTDSGMDELSIQIAVQHHERLSGKGYPYGLKEHQLNQYVRMSCIVDVYDALTAERVYKSGLLSVQAIKIIKEGVGSDFDEKLFNEFIKAIGLFPIGTLVLLTSGRLALVTKPNYTHPLEPIVRVFYNAKFKRHIEVKSMDLASKAETDAIEKAVAPQDYDIDINATINRLILDNQLDLH